MAPDLLSQLPEPRNPDRKLTSDNTLNGWIQEASTKSGVNSERIRWQLATTVITAFLQQELRTAGGAAELLLKGGTYLDYVLDTSRATRDLDLSSRINSEELQGQVLALDGKIFGPFTMRVKDYRTTSVPTKPDELKPVSFRISAMINKTSLGNIKVEVAFGEGDMLIGENIIPAPSTHFFGFDLPAAELIGITMAYQIAQKIHAVSTPSYDGYFNERVRDLTDLILIQQTFYPEVNHHEELRKAALDIFSVRNHERLQLRFPKHDWTPTIPDHAWQELYPPQAAESGITMDYQAARAHVNAWIQQIAAAEAEES